MNTGTMIHKCPHCGHLLDLNVDVQLRAVPTNEIATTIAEQHKPDVDFEISNVPLDTLELSTRIRNAFLMNNRYENGQLIPEPITRVGDVLALSHAELLRTPNLGKKSVAETEEGIERLRNEVRGALNE